MLVYILVLPVLDRDIDIDPDIALEHDIEF
jgi:hypothetical protein